MKPASVVFRFEPDGVFAHAWRAEIVVHASDRNHQRVVAESTLRCELLAFFAVRRRDDDLAALAVEPLHRAQTEPEVMPVRLRDVVQRLIVDAQRSRRELM